MIIPSPVHRLNYMLKMWTLHQRAGSADAVPQGAQAGRPAAGRPARRRESAGAFLGPGYGATRYPAALQLPSEEHQRRSRRSLVQCLPKLVLGLIHASFGNGDWTTTP